MTRTQLKKWRKAAGWTQEFAAFLIGMPYETYRSLETGRRTIPDDMIDRVNMHRSIWAARKNYEFRRRQKRLMR